MFKKMMVRYILDCEDVYSSFIYFPGRNPGIFSSLLLLETY